MFFYSFRHDLLHSNGTWTVSLSGRHTHKRVHITRVAPAGLPDSDLPQKVVCDPTEKRYISGILSGTLVETSGVSDFLPTNENHPAPRECFLAANYTVTSALNERSTWRS